MMRRFNLFVIAFAALLGLGWGGCTQIATLPPPPHPHGQALWHIVHDQCVPNQRKLGDPEPCARVSLIGPDDKGYVLMKDRNGIAQYLLMPTDKITGIEDPAVLMSDGLNYFALAWNARDLVSKRLNKTLPHDYVALTVNSRYGRSQDQLHLHIDCLSQAAHRDLITVSPQITGAWSQRNFSIDGHLYRILRLDQNKLNRTNPFQLLAQGIPEAARNMGRWTLALVGAPDYRGFYLLAGKADPAVGEWGSAEALQDHACRIPASAE